MKRVAFTLILLLMGLSGLSAQEKNPKNSANQLYSLAAQQFQNEEFAICYRTLESLLPPSRQDGSKQTAGLNPVNLEHALFMQASCAFHLNRMDASSLLKVFLVNYPVSVYAPKAWFYLSTCAMNAGQYQDALEEMGLCPRSSLSKKEYEDYRFQKAFCLTQEEKFDEADTLFGELLEEEGRYVAPATYYRAYIQYRKGNAKEAIEGFDKIKDTPPYDETVPFFIMQLLSKEGEYREMLTMAEGFLQSDPDESQRIELYRLSGEGYYELQDYQQSKEYYEKYLAYQPDLLRADAYRIGMDYFIAKDYTKAFTYLSRVTGQEDALMQNATYHIGLCYLQQQKTQQARLSFERASLYDFDLTTKEDALYNYALLCYQTSTSPFDEQVKAFERILNEFPDSRYSTQIYSHLADAFLSANDYQAAIDFIDKADKPSSHMLQTKSQLLFKQGLDLFDTGTFEEALEKFNSSVKSAERIGYTPAEVYYWRGETLYRLNRLADAASNFQDFLNVKDAAKYKAYHLAHYSLAYCHFNLRNYSQALSWFKTYTGFKEVRNDLTYSDALNRIGDCYFYARQYEEAQSYYESCDQLTPAGNDYAAFRQAFCLGLGRKYQEKAGLLNTFEERFPSSDYLSQALFEEGRAYVSCDESVKAISAFDRLMSAFPNSELSRKAGVQIGLLYYHLRETDKAIEAYKNVVNLYPGSNESHTAVNDLKAIYVAQNQVSEFVDYVNTLGPGYAVKAGEQDSLSYQAAEKLMIAHQNEEAIKAFQSYLQQYPQGGFSCEANHWCAQLLSEEKRLEEAIPYYNALRQFPGNPYLVEALSVVSDFYYTQNRWEEALADYRELVKLTDDRSIRIGARTGVMRCLSAQKRSSELLVACNELMGEQNLSPELMREARYNKCMSLISMNRTEEALDDLAILSKDSQTAYGAEARYRVAEYWYIQGNLEQSLKLTQSFIQDGTSQSYWMARCFILMSDIFIQQNDYFQARQYLLSLKENYVREDDIQGMIENRLNRINERSQFE